MKRVNEEILKNYMFIKNNGEIIKDFKDFKYPGGSSGDDGFGGFEHWIFFSLLGSLFRTIETIENAVQDFDKAKNKICYKLISSESFSAQFSTYPTRKVLDMNLLYYLIMEVTEDGVSAIGISDEIAKQWNITEKELYEVAKETTPKIFPLRVDDVLELGKIDISCFDDVKQYSNHFYIGGAVSVFYDSVLENYEKDHHGMNIYVLPVSTNYMFVCSSNMPVEKEKLLSLVHIINSRAESPAEILSVNAYRFNTDVKQLEFV